MCDIGPIKMWGVKFHGFEITNIRQEAGACLTGCHGSLASQWNSYLIVPAISVHVTVPPRRGSVFSFCIPGIPEKNPTSIFWNFQWLLQMIHFLLSWSIFWVDIRSFRYIYKYIIYRSFKTNLPNPRNLRKQPITNLLTQKPPVTVGFFFFFPGGWGEVTFLWNPQKNSTRRWEFTTLAKRSESASERCLMLWALLKTWRWWKPFPFFLIWVAFGCFFWLFFLDKYIPQMKTLLKYFFTSWRDLF